MNEKNQNCEVRDRKVMHDNTLSKLTRRWFQSNLKLWVNCEGMQKHTAFKYTCKQTTTTEHNNPNISGYLAQLRTILPFS